MRRISVIILCMLSTLMAMAQEYNLRWISSPSVDSTAQIWFRNQYVHHKKIKKAYVCIATTGYADLYINRRNASRNYLAPYRQPYSDYPVSLPLLLNCEHDGRQSQESSETKENDEPS